jgi:DNA polymerase-1
MENLYELYQGTFNRGSALVAEYAAEGFRVDVGLVHHRIRETATALSSLEETLGILFGREINYRASGQLSNLLYRDLRLPVPPITGTLKTIKPAPKDKEGNTSEAGLAWVRQNSDPVWEDALTELMLYKKRSRIHSFYKSLLRFIDASGKVHSQIGFNAETGRLTGKNPNLFNQPEEVRDVFVSGPGNLLVVLDYSALEWCLLGHVLAKLYQDFSISRETEHGDNPHAITARAMGLTTLPLDEIKHGDKKAYDAGKALNYSINYGKTPLGLSLQLGISKRQAADYIQRFYRARPSIKRFHKEIVISARAKGYNRTLIGRRRHVDFSIGKKAERQAMNVIQAFGADVITCAMVLCGHGDGRQVLQIYDELIWEVPEHKAESHREKMEALMREPFAGIREPLLCPLKVTGGIGSNWKQAK